MSEGMSEGIFKEINLIKTPKIVMMSATDISTDELDIETCMNLVKYTPALELALEYVQDHREHQDRKLGPFVMQMIFKYAYGFMDLKHYEDLSGYGFIGRKPNKVELAKNEARKLIRHRILKLRLLNRDYAYRINSDFILNSIHLCIENEIPSYDSPQFWRDNFNKAGLLVINVKCKFLNIYYPANNIILIGDRPDEIYVSKDVHYVRIEEGPCNLQNVHARNIKLIGQRSSCFGSVLSPSIKSLSFMDCDCIVFSKTFAYVHSLAISNCINFCDSGYLKPLKNHTLKLKSLHIEDVSFLGHIQNLIIDDLPITSLEGLEHIPRLELRNIRNVDFSNLQNKKLILHNIKFLTGERSYRYDKTEDGPITRTEFEEHGNTITFYATAANYGLLMRSPESFGPLLYSI